eukprot:TRINITY_DN61862_c0_g1_i1.p2 TRINITY_DN61862_c0_g1~~TRINITY_DN61862_c0_g1_i1.p2  ORF type:complete len:148 (-),score=7.79 TRINITY_DN61862_c0_g1_i1:244-687(-)
MLSGSVIQPQVTLEPSLSREEKLQRVRRAFEAVAGEHRFRQKHLDGHKPERRDGSLRQALQERASAAPSLDTTAAFLFEQCTPDGLPQSDDGCTGRLPRACLAKRGTTKGGTPSLRNVLSRPRDPCQARARCHPGAPASSCIQVHAF